jgi:hypothetical protein
MSESSEARAALPPGAVGLGYAGLLPFVAGAFGAALLEGEPRDFAVRALVGYGAVILSFVGAVHWGLLLRSAGGQALRGLLAGVVPSLIGWIALLLAPRHALTVLVVGFGLFWLYEHRVLGPAVLPPAYLSLRRSLSLAVCALLALGLIALG